MWKRRTKSVEPPKGSKDKRAYAIGDVHGCHSELCALLDLIEADCARRPSKPTFLILLGDLIDRGPESRQVIEEVKDRQRSFASYRFLKGNHEEMCVRALSDDAQLIQPWLDHGGYSFAESYGVAKAELLGLDAENLEHVLQSAIPREHLDFMAAFYDSIQFGDYLFAHAGVRPGVAIDEQNPRDLRWIRGDFLESDKELGAVVVHGHTVEPEIVEKPNRIGLDTGAYKTGVLSAVRIEGSERAFLST